MSKHESPKRVPPPEPPNAQVPCRAPIARAVGQASRRGRATSHATASAGRYDEWGCATNELTATRSSWPARTPAVTSFTYDEAGHLLTQTNALGHTTRFGYDELGRLTERTLAGGARETRAYALAAAATACQHVFMAYSVMTSTPVQVFHSLSTVCDMLSAWSGYQTPGGSP
jgi:YD repeat-containing protein